MTGFLFDLLSVFIASGFVVIGIITVMNVFVFTRLRPHPVPANFRPTVTLMIPARNEAHVIGETLNHLLAQDYPHFDVIVLDDDSSDGTGDVVRRIAEGDSRLQLLQGTPLPTGWMGKNWACHQMSQQATGDLLVFTDADVTWESAALSTLVAEVRRTGADLYTVWPTQRTVTWAERLVVPLMAFAIGAYLPVIGTYHAPFAAFGAACGQCMVWRREAYTRVGGHATVSDNVLEDVTQARAVKTGGMRLHMADGGGVISARMYDNWRSVRNGYAKNILAGYGNSVPILLLATVFHWVMFLIPWLWLILGGFIDLPCWPLTPALLALTGLLIRAVTAAYSRQRLVDALLMPVSVLLMTVIAWQAIRWHRTGGPRWKGRTVPHQSAGQRSQADLQTQKSKGITP